MVVAMVATGTISIEEAIPIIMGANIGTTITGWIISVLGFQVKLHTLSIPIFAIAVPLLFINKGKIKFWGEFLIGFAILFLGLQFLQESIPTLQNDSKTLAFLSSLANWGFLSGLIFILLGAITTIIVQSSSAITVASLGFVNAGLINMRQALGIIYGSNIGTTMTGWLVALMGFQFKIQDFAIKHKGLFNCIDTNYQQENLNEVLRVKGNR